MDKSKIEHQTNNLNEFLVNCNASEREPHHITNSNQRVNDGNSIDGVNWSMS